MNGMQSIIKEDKSKQNTKKPHLNRKTLTSYVDFFVVLLILVKIKCFKSHKIILNNGLNT